MSKIVSKAKQKWINEPDIINEYQGFIYLIRNKLTNRKYIGRKTFWLVEKKKPTKYLRKDGKYLKDKKGKRILNTRKTKKHVKKESDWKTYWGSSVELLQDINEIGIENFERTITKLCKSKWECAYFEIKEQIEKEVLTTNEYYNNIINVRIKGKK